MALGTLKDNLEFILDSTPWLVIAKQIPVQKQIELSGSIVHTINLIEKAQQYIIDEQSKAEPAD